MVVPHNPRFSLGAPPAPAFPVSALPETLSTETALLERVLEIPWQLIWQMVLCIRPIGTPEGYSLL